MTRKSLSGIGSDINGQGWDSQEARIEFLRVMSLYGLELSVARSLRRKYTIQRYGASAHGIKFELTFEQWLQIWQDSGHLQERGTRKGQYVMARFGDTGAYAVGNVEIITGEGNRSQVQVRNKSSISKLGNRYALGNRGRLGRKDSEITRAKKSVALLGNLNGFGRKGCKNSEEARANMREGQKRRRTRESQVQRGENHV